MPRPRRNLAATSHPKPGAQADRRAPAIITMETVTYTLFRPSRSAMRPKTMAPMNAPRMAAPVTQLLWLVSRCHWLATSVATVLITNRS